MKTNICLSRSLCLARDHIRMNFLFGKFSQKIRVLLLCFFLFLKVDDLLHFSTTFLRTKEEFCMQMILIIF